MRLLIVSVLLALLPLAGAVYVASTAGWTAISVDKLFMVLMLLTISGVFGLNVLLEARDAGLVPFLKPGPASRVHAITAALEPGAHIDTGVVRELHFFESHVGQQNKTVVEFVPEDSGVSRYLSFLGNVVDQFPLGARLRITYRVEGEGAVLLGREQLIGFRLFAKKGGAAAGERAKPA
jgi:hypothetical protein